MYEVRPDSNSDIFLFLPKGMESVPCEDMMPTETSPLTLSGRIIEGENTTWPPTLFGEADEQGVRSRLMDV